MALTTLKDLYVAELQEARSFEGQIAKAAGPLAEAAQNPQLKKILEDERPEAVHHGERVTALLERHDADPRAHDDQAMRAILEEALKWAGEIDDPAVRDAAIIASVQRIQHYEIAAYGALVAWAQQQKLDEDQESLSAILEAEKSADAKLTKIARDVVNAEAA
jgi:ferritin-like metal-binding protein YciE